MKCPRTTGLGCTNKSSAVARVAPFVSSCKYLERFLNWGWTLFCGAGVVHEPQLAKASTPCGVVSTREKSVFVPGLMELMGYERISRTVVEPYPHRVHRNAPRPFVGLSPPRVSLSLRAAQPINDFFVIFTHIYFPASWTSRRHRCRPFSLPVLAFNFYRA